MKYYLKLVCYTLLVIAAVYVWMKPGKKNQVISQEDVVARGAELVRVGGCADCHTPKLMTPQGLVDDNTRLFAGHPREVEVSPVELHEGPGEASEAGMTAWIGPWGISYASNLTPDPATGLWSEESFIKSMRTGKKRGHGRAILPPMPWRELGQSTDADLKAIYAYLNSLPAVFNSVPDPKPPTVPSTARATVLVKGKSRAN